MESIVIIIDYFAVEWPEYFPLFLESCRYNKTITWLFHTNCVDKSYQEENLIFKKISRSEYNKKVSSSLGINFRSEDNYKICDLKPAYGLIWQDEILAYDIWGHADIDILFGDIRKFYTDKILKNDIISSHDWCLSGHFCLYHNTSEINTLFKSVDGWQAILELEHCQRFDEDHLYRSIVWPNRFMSFWHFWIAMVVKKIGLIRSSNLSIFLKEMYTTPFSNNRPWRNDIRRHPDQWFWKDGRVTNEDDQQEYIYIHFMNFLKPRYLSSKYHDCCYWYEKEKIVYVSLEQMKKDGVRVCPFGFLPMNHESVSNE